MSKRILSQCGVSSDVFIGLIVPITFSFICWDYKWSFIGILTSSFKILNIHKSLELFRLFLNERCHGGCLSIILDDKSCCCSLHFF